MNTYRRFFVTTPGLSATRWLSFALASHPSVYVAHGKHPLDSIITGSPDQMAEKDDEDSFARGNLMAPFYQGANVNEIFQRYTTVKPGALAYGNVHTFTLEALMHKIGSVDELRDVQIANVIRHPVKYIASHLSLVRSAERYPDLYRHYSDTMFREALEQYPELILLPCPDLKLFIAFTVSCLSVCNLAHDFIYPDFPHFQMEILTRDVEVLQKLCESLTGLSYERQWLEKMVWLGAINRHRKSERSSSTLEIYQRWASWQKDMIQMMIPPFVIYMLEDLGYEVSMLKSDVNVSTSGVENEGGPVLGDLIRPPKVHGRPVSEATGPGPGRELAGGYRMVRHGSTFFGLAPCLAGVDLSRVGSRWIYEQRKQGLCFASRSAVAVERCVELKSKLDNRKHGTAGVAATANGGSMASALERLNRRVLAREN